MTIGQFDVRYVRDAILDERGEIDDVAAGERHEHLLIKGYMVDLEQVGKRDILELVNQLDRRARQIAA